MILLDAASARVVGGHTLIEIRHMFRLTTGSHWPPGRIRLKDYIISLLGPPVSARARRGVTLIEAVLFIALALGLIVGGLVFYQQASRAARVNEQVRLFSSMFTEVQALLRGGQWSRSPGYINEDEIGDINKVLLSSGAVSPEFFAGSIADAAGNAWERIGNYPWETPTIKTAWNTASFWGVVPSPLSADQFILEFHITETGVSECSRFLNSVLNGTLQGSAPTGVGVYNGGTSTGTFFSDYSPATSSEACRNQGVDSGRVNIAMYWDSIRF